MSDELQSYFREAVSWDIDRMAQAVGRARIAWVVAGLGWVCAIAVSAAIALMMPLKTVEPYVISFNPEVMAAMMDSHLEMMVATGDVAEGALGPWRAEVGDVTCSPVHMTMFAVVGVRPGA